MEQKTAQEEMTLKESIEFITKNPDWSDFLKGEKACIIDYLKSVKFLIFRNDTGVELYFAYPIDPDLDYPAVKCFFEKVKPYLCKTVREEESKRLTGNDF